MEKNKRYSKLFELIMKRNLAEVKSFVESEGITLEEYYSLGTTASDKGIWFLQNCPLRAAALSDAPDILKYFISLGFDPHGAHLGDGDRPIHAACLLRPLDLLDEDDDEEDEEEIEKKAQQARADNFEVVRILVEDYKVDVNVLNRRYTPLLSAAEEGRLEVAKLLVRAGVDINATDWHKGYTALHLAAMSSSTELCEYLLSLQGMEVSATDASERIPLHYAAYHNHVKSAELFLDAGADVNKVDRWGCSPLQSAIMTRSHDSIRLLCSRGANTEDMIFVAMAGNDNDYEIIRYLVVDQGVSLETRTYDQDTPFSLAMKTGKMKVAELLISCGCTIDKGVCTLERFQADSSECLHEWETFVKRIQEMSENPRRLQDICCFKIRSLLGSNIEESVNILSIPTFLKNIVLLKHVYID